MRHLSLAVVTSLALYVAACDGGDDNPSSDGTGGAGGDDTNAGGDGSSDGGDGSSIGGTFGSSDVEFMDLPGKIRFINYVSDGTQGVNLDLYWGTSLMRSEKVPTLEYGVITEYLTPRRIVDSVLDPDEARFFIVPEGDVSGTPTSFLVQDDPTFDADTVLTVALAGADNFSSDNLIVAEQIFYETELSTPPTGMAHVYGWSKAFDQIDGGDFVLVGADGLCSPDLGVDGGSNIGTPALIPDGTTGLSLFDANGDPPCNTGAEPLTESVEAGHSYVILGEAETFELDARHTVLLEVGTEN